jgi:xylulokinase
MPFSSQSLVPKLRWVAANEPEVARGTATWLTANGFVAFRLTGSRAIDHHQAGYLAPHYVDGALTADADPALPPPVWSDEIVGTVTADAAGATGLPAGIPVIIGSSDGATDPVGAGVGAGPVALLRYGSTLGVTVIAAGDRPGVPGVWRTPGNRAGETMYVGGLSTAGSVTSWFREELARDLPHGDSAHVAEAHRALLAEAAGSPIGAGGVLTLPYFSGERTPFSDPLARGVIAGIGLATTRGDLYRSVLEGAAFGLRHLLEVVRDGGVRIDRFRAVGGGTAGGLWTQIVSDVTGVPQDIVDPHLGAPLGAARLAAEGAELLDADAPPWVTVARTVSPDPAARAAYDATYPLFRRLYTATRDIVAELPGRDR